MAAKRHGRSGLIAGMAVLLCAILCGCERAPLLSQREIVHGIFFESLAEQSAVLLLVAEQPAEQDGAASYKTVVGTGRTPAKALEQAETSLDGQVFYGLMDLVVLPAENDWQSTVELGRLLYEKAQPAPQFTLFLMDSLPIDGLTEKAAGLYEEMQRACSKYGICNGLQSLFWAPNECALPLWQGAGYGFVFLQEERANTQLESGLYAQLAAILCGQADRFACEFSAKTASVQAQAMVQHEVDESGKAVLRLTLEAPDLQDLSGAKRGEEQLQKELDAELEQAFAQMLSQCAAPGFDPLHIRVWAWSGRGLSDDLPQPELWVSFET